HGNAHLGRRHRHDPHRGPRVDEHAGPGDPGHDRQFELLQRPESRAGPHPDRHRAHDPDARLMSTTTFRFRSMATDISVLLPSSHRREAIRVQRLFVDWDRRLSRFRRDSERSCVNAAAGTDVEVSAVTFEVIDAALQAARATNGRFDPLLGARMRELGYDRTYATLPTNRPGAPLAAWHPGLWRQVRLDRERSLVRVPVRRAVDLGGIAKGMAADAALAELVAAGVPYALVNAGGDLAAYGTPQLSPGWPVGIDNVDLAGGAALLAHGAMATS